jgi:hypothetical protein
MTREQFNNYHFTVNTIVIIDGKEYPIYSVDFDGVIGYKYTTNGVEYADFNIVELKEIEK